MAATTYYAPVEIQTFLERFGDLLDPMEIRMREKTRAYENSDYQVSVEFGGLLKTLVCMLQPRRCLEVGSYTGYSGACIASMLEKGATLHSLEKNPDVLGEAKLYWEGMGLADKIHPVLGDATETLPKLLQRISPDTVDFVFLDADKSNVKRYFDLCINSLSERGVILVDNVFRQGRIVKPASDEGTKEMRRLIEAVCLDPTWRTAIVPVGDGVLIATRLLNTGGTA